MGVGQNFGRFLDAVLETDDNCARCDRLAHVAVRDVADRRVENAQTVRMSALNALENNGQRLKRSCIRCF